MRIRHMAIVASAVAGLSVMGATAHAQPAPPPPGGSSFPGIQLPQLPALPLPAPKPAPPQQQKPPAPAGTPCAATARACVSIQPNGKGQAWLLRNGVVEYGPVAMSAGRKSHPTPPGTFRVLRKEKDSWSKPYNAPMPYSVYFTGDGIAFHDGSPNELSHGCIHLWRKDAIKFYEALQVGDAVQVVT